MGRSSLKYNNSALVSDYNINKSVIGGGAGTISGIYNKKDSIKGLMS
jgi:hypothetical protein